MRWWVWLIIVGVVLAQAAVTGAWILLRARHVPEPVVYAPAAHPTTPWRGTSSPHLDEDEETTSPLPRVKRSVPLLDVRVLDGCSKTDLDAVETNIQSAINVGAPMYNEGDFGGCFRTYEAAALSIEKAATKSCKGPPVVLKSGRERAGKLGTAAEQAWAMRDAFDGLLDVIDRKGTEL